MVSSQNPAGHTVDSRGAPQVLPENLFALILEPIQMGVVFFKWFFKPHSKSEVAS